MGYGKFLLFFLMLEVCFYQFLLKQLLYFCSKFSKASTFTQPFVIFTSIILVVLHFIQCQIRCSYPSFDINFYLAIRKDSKDPSLPCLHHQVVNSLKVGTFLLTSLFSGSNQVTDTQQMLHQCVVNKVIFLCT